MSGTRAMNQQVRDLCATLTLTPPFRPETFVEELAGSRGLTIRLIAFPMAETVTGYVLRPAATEYVVFYDPASPYRSIYHECGHIVYDHVPVSSPEEIARFLDPVGSLVPAPLLRSNARFTLPQEMVAESFAIAMSMYSVTAIDDSPAIGSVSRSLPGEAPSVIGRFYDELGS